MELKSNFRKKTFKRSTVELMPLECLCHVICIPLHVIVIWKGWSRAQVRELDYFGRR